MAEKKRGSGRPPKPEAPKVKKLWYSAACQEPDCKEPPISMDELDPIVKDMGLHALLTGHRVIMEVTAH